MFDEGCPWLRIPPSEVPNVTVKLTNVESVMELFYIYEMIQSDDENYRRRRSFYNRNGVKLAKHHKEDTLFVLRYTNSSRDSLPEEDRRLGDDIFPAFLAKDNGTPDGSNDIVWVHSNAQQYGFAKMLRDKFEERRLFLERRRQFCSTQ